MDFKKFSEKYASEIGGEYREYDSTQSVIIMPVADGRFQTITGHITHNSDYNRQMIQLKTKVCSLDNEIPFEDLLRESADYPYSKFIIEDGFLKVEAIAFLASTSEEMIKEMFSEIGKHADDWEFKLTGKDIH